MTPAEGNHGSGGERGVVPSDAVPYGAVPYGAVPYGVVPNGGPPSYPSYPTSQGYPGYSGYPPPGYGYPQRPPGNGLGVAGGIIGIVGFVLCCIPLIGIVFGFLIAPFAIVFSVVGLSRAPKGMAITGFVLGILTLVFKSIPIVNLL